MANPKPTFELLPDTELLIARFRKMAIGDTITWEEIERIVRRDRTSARGIALSARKRVLQQDGILLEAVYRVGLKRAAPEDAYKVGDRAIRHIHRTSKGAISKIKHAIQGEQLNGDAGKLTAARLSGLGALMLCSTRNNLKRLEGKVGDAEDQIPAGQTLRLFAGAKNGEDGDE